MRAAFAKPRGFRRRTSGGTSGPTFLGLVLNGDFGVDDPIDGSVAWGPIPYSDGATGWTISGGEAELATTGSGNAGLAQTIAVEVGPLYQVSADVEILGGTTAGGGIRVGLTSDTIQSGDDARTTTGTISYTTVFSATSTRFEVVTRVTGASATTNAIVDNASLSLAPVPEVVDTVQGSLVNGAGAEDVTLPDHSEGDLLVMVRSSDGSINGDTVTGWTAVAVTAEATLHYKIAGADETVVAVPKHSNRRLAYIIASIKNVDGSDIVDATGTLNTGDSDVATFNSVTTTETASFVLAMAVLDDDASTTLVSGSSGYDNSTFQSADAISGSNSILWMGTKLAIATGAETPGDVTFSTSDTFYTFAIAFNADL